MAPAQLELVCLQTRSVSRKKPHKLCNLHNAKKTVPFTKQHNVKESTGQDWFVLSRDHYMLWNYHCESTNCQCVSLCRVELAFQRAQDHRSNPAHYKRLHCSQSMSQHWSKRPGIQPVPSPPLNSKTFFSRIRFCSAGSFKLSSCKVVHGLISSNLKKHWYLSFPRAEKGCRPITNYIHLTIRTPLRKKRRVVETKISQVLLDLYGVSKKIIIRISRGNLCFLLESARDGISMSDQCLQIAE